MRGGEVVGVSRMFDSICIRQQSLGELTIKEPLDVGFLAEAMLFYQDVHVIANRGIIKQLISKCGSDVLFDLLDSGFLKISFLENFDGIYTENGGTPYEHYTPILGSMPHRTWKEDAKNFFGEVAGGSVKGGQRLAKKFGRHIKPIVLDSSLQEETLADFSSGGYLRDSVVHLLRYLAPGYSIPGNLVFAVTRKDSKLFVDTNIDFLRANVSYHQAYSSSHSSLSIAYLLSILMAARGDWYFASRFSSEVATNSVNSVVFRLKFDELLKARTKSKNQISTFQDFVLDDGRALREAINSGGRSFADLRKVLSSATKFRDWLKNRDPDQELVKAYFREVTKGSWVDRLPAKSVRWSIFTGLGFAVNLLAPGIGTATGVALSAADAFLLDRLLKGWKPNQFIDDSLGPFTAKRDVK